MDMTEELVILSHLRKNAREQLTSISKKTRIPVSTIFNKLRNQMVPLIRRHTCIIDFARIGYSTVATMIFKVDKPQKEEFRDELRKCRNVNSLQKINNGSDFLCETVFRDMKQLEDFLEGLEEKYKIRQKQVFYHIEDIKREEFLAEPELTDLLFKG